jgi:bacillithiol system protein YtxJ
MSFFKNIFGQNDGTDSNKGVTPWIELTTLEQLDEIVSLSAAHTCVIFKHSTRCIVSRTALKQFEMEFVPNDKIKLFYLDLLSFRPISNAIAERFNIEHQSPQIIVIKNGKVVFSTSHSDIDATILERFI